MKIDKLIKELEQVKEQHGNLEVIGVSKHYDTDKGKIMMEGKEYTEIEL